MQRIVVLNPKGGSGKTTIAINLASYYAVQGLRPVLMDYDPQASSTRWLKKRSAPQPLIHGIAAYDRNARTTRSFQLRAPGDSQRQVIDTPAAVGAAEMPELVRGADRILVPVLPSDIDIHACSKCIADLLLVAKVKRADNRIGVIANRVKKNTLVYQSLMRFLATLHIPIVATFRDSQNYIRAAELGVGIHEMKGYLVREDLDQWLPLIQWLEAREGASAEAVASPAETPVAVVVPVALVVPVTVVAPISEHAHTPGQLNGSTKAAMAAEPTIEYTVTSEELTPDVAPAPEASVGTPESPQEGQDPGVEDPQSARNAAPDEAAQAEGAPGADDIVEVVDPLVDTIVASEAGS